MRVNSFNINVIDTLESTTVLVLEDAQVNAPKLLYLGGDDKFNNLLTSELQFNFWVSENVDAKYFHLFTGSEKRFKVTLEDTSVANYAKTIWSGYLLPEQFNEPYKHSGFFVNFTATDGIGLLKNKDYYINPVAEKQSVLQVISNCLLQTNLQLAINFSEAIVSVGFNLDYLDLEVNTLSYKSENGETKSYYDVLVACLESIGCVLFLYENAWYIIGLNKFKEASWVCCNYTLDSFFKLQFNKKVIINRTIEKGVFEASPNITVIPPLQKMTTVWDSESAEILVPEDIVTHLPVNIDTDIDDRTPKYWYLEASKSILLKTWLFLLNFDGFNIDFNTYYNGFKFKKAATLEDNVSGPFLSVSNGGETISLADLETNFVSLSKPFFIYGSEDLERFGTLSISFDSVLNTSGVSPIYTETDFTDYFKLEGVFTSSVNNGLNFSRITSVAHGLETEDYINITSGLYKGTHLITKIDADTFDIEVAFTVTVAGKWKIKPFYNVFHFAISRKDHLTTVLGDEELYFSTFESLDIPKGLFAFDLSVKNGAISGVLDLEKIAFTEDGYYNFRLYPIVSHRMLPGLNIVIYTSLKTSLETVSKKELVKNRSIDFTTSYSLDLFHSSSRDSFSNKSFLFSDNLSTEILNGNLVAGELFVSPISKSFKDINSGGQLWYTIIKIELSESDIVKIQNGYKIFVLKTGQTELQEILSNNYTVDANSINQIKFVDSAEIFIEETDVIYIKLTSSSEDLAYSEFWLDKWQRYDVVESIDFYEAVNKIHHDLLHEYNFRVEGVYFGLLAPVDIFEFNYKDSDYYYPVSLEISLSEGKTTATIVEQKNENVIDYV